MSSGAQLDAQTQLSSALQKPDMSDFDFGRQNSGKMSERTHPANPTWQFSSKNIHDMTLKKSMWCALRFSSARRSKTRHDVRSDIFPEAAKVEVAKPSITFSDFEPDLPECHLPGMKSSKKGISKVHFNFKPVPFVWAIR